MFVKLSSTPERCCCFSFNWLFCSLQLIRYLAGGHYSNVIRPHRHLSPHSQSHAEPLWTRFCCKAVAFSSTYHYVCENYSVNELIYVLCSTMVSEEAERSLINCCWRWLMPSERKQICADVIQLVKCIWGCLYEACGTNTITANYSFSCLQRCAAIETSSA